MNVEDDAGSLEYEHQLSNIFVNNKKRWVFSGFYPFQDTNLPYILSKLYNQPIFDVCHNVVGLLLPYPHGFDDDISLQHGVIYDRNFLHIFNIGRKQKNVIGVAKCVKYETGLLPSMKRISFSLE